MLIGPRPIIMQIIKSGCWSILIGLALITSSPIKLLPEENETRPKSGWNITFCNEGLYGMYYDVNNERLGEAEIVDTND